MEIFARPPEAHREDQRVPTLKRDYHRDSCMQSSITNHVDSQLGAQKAIYSRMLADKLMNDMIRREIKDEWPGATDTISETQCSNFHQSRRVLTEGPA